MTLSDDIADLAAEVRLLRDRVAIGDLLLSFGATLDTKDWTAYGETFVENGICTILGHARRGREEIAAAPARDFSDLDVVQHFSCNHWIRIDGDQATASHYLIAVHVPDATAPSVHADIGGRYECRCVRTAEGWRFAEVELKCLWTAGAEFSLQP